LVDRQGGKCCADLSLALCDTQQVGAGRRPVVGGQRHGGSRGTASGAIEARVHNDAVQPGGDTCLAAEGFRRPQGIDERVLDGVGGLFRIAEGTHRHRPEPVAVSTNDLAEGGRVTGNVPSEQLLVGDCVVDGDGCLRIGAAIGTCCTRS
jgi:hypothetical protein